MLCLTAGSDQCNWGVRLAIINLNILISHILNEKFAAHYSAGRQ